MNESELEDIFKSLHTSRKGLSEEEARERLRIYGENSLEKKRKPYYNIVRIITNPVNLMLIAAALISYLTGSAFDAYLIIFLLFVDGGITFYQEHKSERYLEVLRKKLEREVKVLRDNEWKEISSKYIVPGDIIKLEAGESLPADIKVIEAKNLLIDQSVITGESLPVEAKEGDTLYAPSIIKRGECLGVVTATGVHTKYGQLLNIIQSTKNKSNLENTVIKIGIFLMITALILISIFTVYFYYKGWSLYQLLLFSITLLVAAVPIALPAVVSSTLLYSAYVLAKRDILVRRLSSIFDISQVNMLCTDKTGTLTENKIKLDKIIPIETNEEEVIRLAYLTSDLEEEGKDPIDTAVIEHAKSKGIDLSRDVIKEFYPYDSVRKYSYAILKDGTIIKKGSAEKLLEETNSFEKYQKILDSLYEEGYRVLAVVKNNKVIGFLAFYDPPRKDAYTFISNLKELGLSIKMLTGDSKKIAIKVAKEVGIDGLAISRNEMYKIDTKQHFDYIAEKYDIFAEIYPEDKYKIVESLNKKYKVGVTGDGVNDVGAFKVASVGIAVYNAVEAAKEFADLILTAPGLSQLVEAIKESRKGTRKIENYIVFRVAEEMAFPYLSALLPFIFGLTLSPIFLILLKVLNNIPIMAIAFDKVEGSKRPYKLSLRNDLIASFILGVASIIFTLLYVFLFGKYIFANSSVFQMLLFLELLLTGHFLLFAVRTREKFWFREPPMGVLLWAILSTQIIGTIVIIFYIIQLKLSMLYLELVGLTWLYSIFIFFITDFIKIAIYRKLFPRLESN